MARGRQQKWICRDCKQEFSVQGNAPRLCCTCGSANLGRAPSYELAINFDEKRKRLEEICSMLNPAYEEFLSLKAEFDEVMQYWKQQRARGYITKEEYQALSEMYVGNIKK